MDFVTRLRRAEPDKMYDVTRRERADVAAGSREAELVVEHTLDVFAE